MSRGPITGFLLAVRRRLWIEAALRQLRTAVWVASATLALLALLHVAWQPVALTTATAAALAVGFIVLLPALFSQPALTECALRADRHFRGRALLTTAHEFGGATELRPAEETVLKRALAASAAWRPRLGEIWHTPPRRGYVLAVIPAFFATLLLQLPPAEGFVASTAAEDAPPADELAPARALAGADDLAAVREAIVQGVADEERGSNRERAAGAAQLADVDPQALSAQVETEEREGGEPGIAGTSDDGGVAPGDARRRPIEDEREPDAAAPSFTRIATASIERHGSRAAGRNETGDTFTTAAESPDTSLLNIAAVPAPPVASSWTMMTAAELAYVRRYLDLKDQNDE